MSIPGLPGVPPLKATLKRNLISTAPVALFDAFIGKANQTWGVFDGSSKLVLKPDSFIGIDYRPEWRLSDYPVEKGTFSTYNKVRMPFEAIVTLACGGAQSKRSSFAKSVEAIAQGVGTYTIVTPDEKFTSVNIERYEYERQAERGANLLIVRLYFKQVINTASTQYTQTKTGKPINSTVPKAQQTQTTTSTGVASATKTANPSGQGIYHEASVSSITKYIAAAHSGYIQ